MLEGGEARSWREERWDCWTVRTRVRRAACVARRVLAARRVEVAVVVAEADVDDMPLHFSL